MARSSRPSPFKRSISALVPAPPGEGAQPTHHPPVDAHQPESGHSAHGQPAVPRSGSQVPVPVPSSTRRVPGADGSEGLPLVAGDGVSSRRFTTQGPGPLAFTPLRDDPVRRGRKFLGLHKTLLTTPGRSAAHLLGNYYRPLVALGVVALLVVGGIFAWQAAEDYWSGEAAQRRQARDQAIEDGSYAALVAFARQYGPEATDDDGVRKALVSAWRAETDRLVHDAETALRSGDIDAARRLDQQLDELAANWAATTGEQDVPADVQNRIDSQIAWYRRTSVAELSGRVRREALAAESMMANGNVDGAMDAWEQSRAQLVELAKALDIPADQRPQIDREVRNAHEGVLRAATTALGAQLRSAAEQAKIASRTDPDALADYADVRADLIATGREHGLSERDLNDLGRDADRFIEEISRQLATTYHDRLEALYAQSTQQIASPDGSLRNALEQYRATAQSLIAEARDAGLSGSAIERLDEQSETARAGLRERALDAAADADVDELKGLLALLGEDEATRRRLNELITAALIRDGNLEGADEFSTGEARVHTAFASAMRDLWVLGNASDAGDRLSVLVASPEAQTARQANRLGSLLAIAGAWRDLIDARATGGGISVRVRDAARAVPPSTSPTWALQTFSVAWFRMRRAEFAGAALLLRQVEGKLPAGYPLAYLQTVAAVRAGDAQITDAELARRPGVSDHDRNKLFLLRYITSVEQAGNVYDNVALDGIGALMDSGQLDALLPELGREAGLALDGGELRFTLGTIRYFYHVQRSSGFGLMRRPAADPWKRAADLLERLMQATHPLDDADLSPDVMLPRIGEIIDALPTDEGKWPLTLVQAMATFDLAWHHPQPAAPQARGALALAQQKFQQLADRKPVLAPMASVYQARAALMRDVAANTEQADKYLREAIDRLPGFAEARYWLADVALASDDREFALSMLREAAGLEPGTRVEVVWPMAFYRLAELAGSGLASQYAQQYRQWYERADDIARREFPTPIRVARTPGIPPSGDTGNGGSETPSHGTEPGDAPTDPPADDNGGNSGPAPEDAGHRGPIESESISGSPRAE